MEDEPVYTFYSQQGEDIFVYKHFLNQTVPDGIFVEVGAYDGVAGSNTKFFEDVLGYTGLLIDPLTEYIGRIKAERPRSNHFPVAIHPTLNAVPFLGTAPTAGIPDAMSMNHKQVWHPSGGEIYNVPAFRLADILGATDIRHIDFLSIDVEGGEQLVLESIDWDAVEIFVIVIELDGANGEKDENCRRILQKAGFVFQTFLGNNDLWVNLNYSRRKSRYGLIKPYFAEFKYLNAQAKAELPFQLSNFLSPLLIE